jgi:hypothetical protein
MKTHLKIIVVLITILITALPLSCSPSVTKEDAKKELVSFMLDFIVQQKIEGPENHNQSNNPSQVNPLLDASMIVLLPPNEDFNGAGFDYLRFDEPIQVWLYDDGNLEEVNDKEAAIQKYQEVYMTHNPNPGADSWFWGFYQFGIMSISRTNTKATIYLVDSFGPDTAGGLMYTVQRDELGKWSITHTELLWLS